MIGQECKHSLCQQCQYISFIFPFCLSITLIRQNEGMQTEHHSRNASNLGNYLAWDKVLYHKHCSCHSCIQTYYRNIASVRPSIDSIDKVVSLCCCHPSNSKCWKGIAVRANWLSSPDYTVHQIPVVRFWFCLWGNFENGGWITFESYIVILETC